MIFRRDSRQDALSVRGSRFHFAFIGFILVCAAVTTAGSVSAATIVVPGGGDLQAAINAAQPGDTIVLQAGAAYVGAFVLPNKQGSAYVTIQSSALTQLPSAGQRVSPAHASLMPRVLSPGFNQAVISTAPYAHHYQFLGIEFAPVDATVVIGDLIKLGDGSSTQNTLDQVPHHLLIDRCYIHGWPTQNVKRGIALNSSETSIINSHISEIHVEGQDTQAICGWNGPGPYHIINNYLEAAGENVMFGGADPAIANLMPSDIEIRRNKFFKPLSWKVGDPSYAGRHWTVKNLLETKNVRRVQIDGNTFENCWPDAQIGFAILFKSMNQDGGCPWCASEDITFTNNIIKNSEHALNLSGFDPYHPSAQMKRLVVANNLWTGIAKIFLQSDGPDTVVLEHNTFFIQQGNTFTLYGRPTTNFTFRNNIGVRAGYGIKGDSAAEGSASLALFCPGYIFQANAIVDADPMLYPSGNFYPTPLTDVGFFNLAAGNYRLAATSAYRNAGTDGKDIGVDFNALNSAQGGALPTPTPSPTATAAPTPTLTPTPTPNPTPTLTPTPTPKPTATPTPTPTPTPTLTPTPTPIPTSTLPAPWLNRDVGMVGLPGIATVSNRVFSGVSSGTDIWGREDGFHYAYQPLVGDGQIVARVASIQNTSAVAKAGVMIRETLTANSKHAFIDITAGSGSEFLRRGNTGGITTASWGSSRPPSWVKLVRSGNVFSGYTSNDGVHWTLLGSDTINMAANVYVGLAVTSHNNSVLCRATFDNVSVPLSNPIDDARTFVRQQYYDFLNREPDSGGWNYWTRQITNCPAGNAECVRLRRIGVSAAFFIELEFQETGNFVYRFYRSSLGRRPSFAEFMSDRAQLVGGPNLEANKQSFAVAWAQRTEFLQKYPTNMSGAQFIDALLQTVQRNSGVDISSQRPALIADWNAYQSRARVLSMVADTPAFVQSEYNAAFVLMQYFGYLRRDPDPGGYSFWLNVLNNRDPNNYRGMVCSFITAAEYQLRFASAITRTNGECGL